MQMLIGVLALQGSFLEHINALKKCKVKTREVRLASDLEGLQGLIIPGGESTAIRKLMNWNQIREKILENTIKGMKVLGTCAGTVLMAGEIAGKEEGLGLIGISVERNSYGRQLQSRERKIMIKGIGEFNGVFIRAPKIVRVGEDVSVLARDENGALMVENECCIATCFHPELGEDLMVHKYFIKKIKKKKKKN